MDPDFFGSASTSDHAGAALARLGPQNWIEVHDQSDGIVCYVSRTQLRSVDPDMSVGDAARSAQFVVGAKADAPHVGEFVYGKVSPKVVTDRSVTVFVDVPSQRDLVVGWPDDPCPSCGFYHNPGECPFS